MVMSQTFATYLLLIAMPSGLAFQNHERPVQRRVTGDAAAIIDPLGDVSSTTGLATKASSPETMELPHQRPVQRHAPGDAAAIIDPLGDVSSDTGFATKASSPETMEIPHQRPVQRHAPGDAATIIDPRGDVSSTRGLATNASSPEMLELPHDRPVQRHAPGLATNASSPEMMELAGNRRRDRRRRTTTTTTRKKGVQYEIDFGGRAHHETDQRGDGQNEIDLSRPEQAKSQRCKGSVCSDCADRDQCWHGRGGDELEATMPAHSIYTELAVDVFGQCATSGYWEIKVLEMAAAVIAIYINGILQKKEFERLTGEKDSDRLKIPTEAGKGYHVRVTLRRRGKDRDAGEAIKARIKLRLSEASIAVDQCMGMKNECLQVFGDQTDASFQLRNNKVWQLRCLEVHALVGTGPDDKCKEWLNCLPDEMKPKLVAFLRVAGTPTSSMPTEESSLQQLTPCVDPSIEDAEAWDCDCLEEIVESCGGLSEDCLKSRLCKLPKVCESWTKQHCSSSMIAMHKNTSAKGGQQASALMSRRTEFEANVGDSLDSSMQGKCSQ